MKLGLYVHIPFCERRCHYCDFLTYPHQEGFIKDYIAALISEIHLYRSRDSRKEVDSIYIGGGTPTYISGSYIGNILQALQDVFEVDSESEITIEGNPQSLELETLKSYRGWGINRFSLGVQSFQNEDLKRLGRNHTGEDVVEDVEKIRQSGFQNINLDMIQGFPRQTLLNLEKDIERAVAINPEHISYYNLILEEKTYMKHLVDKGNLLMLDEDLEYEMNKKTIDLLTRHGYHRYEISNFSKPGYESIHNKKYWSLQPYIGLGVGSHSNDQHRRWSNYRTFENYFKCIREQRLPIKENISITTEEEIKEFIIMNLRMTRGFSEGDFEKRFARRVEDGYGEIVERYIHQGLLAREKGRIFFTERGMDLSNVFYREII